MTRWLGIAAIAALVVPATAESHAIVRQGAGHIRYESPDATSLNTLAVELVGGEVRLRDPTVDGGMDTGSCRPGAVNERGFVIEAFCSAAGVLSMGIDVADREDTVTVAVPIPTRLLAGGGADTVSTSAAADVVSGEGGNDALASGAGNDQLDGGEGADRLDGGEGDDELRVRDGIADDVACGPGSDRVDADQLDRVGADCEAVTRTTTAPPPTASDAAGGPDMLAPRPSGTTATRRRLGRGVIPLRVRSTEPGTISTSGYLDAGDLRLPIDATRRRVTRPDRTLQLVVRLSRRHRRAAASALRRGQRVFVRLSVVATDEAGNSRQKRLPRISLRR